LATVSLIEQSHRRKHIFWSGCWAGRKYIY